MTIPIPVEAPMDKDEGEVMPRAKLHGRAFYNSIGCPRRIVAPMVDASELAWRILSRRYGADAAYSPMLHARLFADSAPYRRQSLRPQTPSPPSSSPASTSPAPASQTIASASTSASICDPTFDGDLADRPLHIQFCANDPAHLLAAAKLAQLHCDAVDLNLGCPQGIAKKGRYGAFLQEHPDLIRDLISTLHKNLDVPVTAKIRVLDSKEKTLAYARLVLDAGASILTVHGRRRDQKSHNTGLADWSYIRYLRDNLPPDTVIYANGNILYNSDVDACLAATGADAVMAAETNLYNPAVFLPSDAPFDQRFPRVDRVVREYLTIVRDLTFGPRADELQLANRLELTKDQARDHPSLNSVKMHLFKLLHAVFARKENHYIRNMLGKVQSHKFADVLAIAAEVDKVVEQQLEATPETPEQWDEIMKLAGGPGADATVLPIPWWRCQPHVRPTPEQAYENGAMRRPRKERAADPKDVDPKESSLAESKESSSGELKEKRELEAESESAPKRPRLEDEATVADTSSAAL
ncbi:hypothetical protein Dda_9187 [Drechslerella dactyloides]|uniref:tRNA-dihydrouridine(16/17) synthase [NAD(P)(+)] n=1 Tax=Drechslerella dactyloides TaxID=74499 RepID=A0AAD6IR97_DREDA|nr:hypothetical protein Dda_9187 [Drechslerella dactyloides]